MIQNWAIKFPAVNLHSLRIDCYEITIEQFANWKVQSKSEFNRQKKASKSKQATNISFKFRADVKIASVEGGQTLQEIRIHSAV